MRYHSCFFPFPINTTISHQTGLSATVSTANAPVNIGSAITIVNNGIISIAVAGHVSAGIGSIRILRTRNSVTDIINQLPQDESTTNQAGSLFSDGQYVLADSVGIASGTRNRLNKTLSTSVAAPFIEVPDVLLLDAIAGDSFQFQVSNNTAGDITYIDDLVVMQ